PRRAAQRPAATGMTAGGGPPVVREPALGELAPDQELGATRLEPPAEFLLEPDTSPPDLAGRVKGRFIPRAARLPPLEPPISVLGQHAGKRTTESESPVDLAQ